MNIPKKCFNAISIGQAALNTIRQNQYGQVHSVFDRTFNILFGGELVGVGLNNVSLSPIDMIADIPNTDSMLKLGIKKGMKVEFKSNQLMVGDLMVILLKGVKSWHPATKVELPHGLEEITRNLELAKRAAVVHYRIEGLGQLLPEVDRIFEGQLPAIENLNEFAKESLPHTIKLLKSARCADITGVKKSAENLIGLGLGLTPSADDMLVGFTSSLWWISHSLNKGLDTVHQINEAVVFRVERTNLLSRQLLRHAAKGEVNEHLTELLEGVLSRTTSDIGKLVEKIMEIGETSGLDMTLGILFGIRLGVEITK